MGRLILLSGPSCAGKSPLLKAMRRLHPELAEPLRPLVLYNSRAARPGERDGEDYHFRTREQIEPLRNDERYRVMDVRGDLQALDLRELRESLAKGDVFFEGNPFVGGELLDVELPGGAERISAFLSPLSLEEIRELARPQRNVDLPALVADVMRRKLLRRTTRQKGHLSQNDLAEIERRCTSAWGELQLAWRFDGVIPNHDGEDSENWDAFYYPLGDARRALVSFCELLQGRTPPLWETWPRELPA